jgi:hypothetical protein
MSPNEAALDQVVFTIAAENLEYTEGIDEAVIAPIDIPELRGHAS